ncbi:MAG: hypothetical protein IKU24_05145, partial [Clostridia bacterium]|nr:hypothetical protein [Clostridia bacterium]
FQVNLYSFTDLFSRYRALRLADEGMIHFLGEDIHSCVMDPKERKKRLAFWEKKRPGFLEKIAKRTEKALFLNKK